MSSCHLVAGRSLIDLVASRLALRPPHYVRLSTAIEVTHVLQNNVQSFLPAGAGAPAEGCQHLVQREPKQSGQDDHSTGVTPLRSIRCGKLLGDISNHCHLCTSSVAVHESAIGSAGLPIWNVRSLADIGSIADSTPSDARNDLAAWRKEGKHAALIRLKSGDTTKFVVVPLSLCVKMGTRPEVAPSPRTLAVYPGARVN
jgi:hypothetical protein